MKAATAKATSVKGHCLAVLLIVAVLLLSIARGYLVNSIMHGDRPEPVGATSGGASHVSQSSMAPTPAGGSGSTF